MAITIPTVDEFTESTVMLVIREIAEYICGDNGLVAQINNNDITGFTSSYTNNILKIDATKGDGSTLPICNVTIEGGGSSTGNPYPTGVSGTVGSDGNITFTITMSSGSPLTTTINMNYFASTADLSDLQEQVTELKITSSGNIMSINGTSANIVNSVTGSVSGGNLTIGVNGINSSPIEIGGGGSQWENIDLSNIPSDFRVGDLIYIELIKDVSGGTQGWDRAPTSSDIRIYTPSQAIDQREHLAFMFVLQDWDSSHVENIKRSTDTSLIALTVSVSRASYWNRKQAGLNQLNIRAMIYNGAGSYNSSDAILVSFASPTNDIYILKRMRTN